MATPDDVRAQIVAQGRALKGTLAYDNAVQKPTLAQLRRRGSGDCSDTMWALFNEHGYDIGGMSYTQAQAGTLVASGSTPAEFKKIEHLLRPADLVGMAMRSGLHGGAQINHVGMWTGTGFLDHGGPGRGPVETSIYDRWNLGDAARWVVRRVVQDDQPIPSEEDELNKDQEAKLNRIAALVDQLHYAQEKIILPALGRLDVARVAETARDAATTAAVKALADGKGLDAGAVGAAVNDAVAKAMEGIEITLAAKPTA